ncbi:NACHT, LRR and PYD domains-containing protein 3-like [Engraulis encrasicolus]|uniref:NACHT, LRR and PYD domains-containing protein 3-like n=1 Tax=Engraulis encrasicolus TaxID=184585 RepID=UPI002FD6835C
MSVSQKREEAVGHSETLRPESALPSPTGKNKDPVAKDKGTDDFSTKHDAGAQTPRAPSPVPSCVSMKSDRSMPEKPDFRNDPMLPHPQAQTPRAPSPVSLRSDRSMPEKPDFRNDQMLPHPHAQNIRAPSPVPSCVSLMSDRSMPEKPDFSNAQLTQYESSCEQVLRDPAITSCRQKNKQDAENLMRVKETHKASLKRRFQNIFEGIAKPGAETLLNESYTELYITKGESEGVNKEHEVWQVESASRAHNTEDTPINCNDIFKPLPGQERHIRTVMTKGVAGIGKTVSVQKFILDWTDGLANHNVDFMFPLPFRGLNLIKRDQYSLHNLLLGFHPELRELRDGEEYKDHQILFIFDGLDESRLNLNFEQDVTRFDVQQTSSIDVLISNLIQGALLPSALIWITTRPAAANQIPPQYINQLTEVRGFNDPQKIEYFRKRISDDSLAKRIVSHIKASRSLYIMCHIPVFCWITATVLQQMLKEKNLKKIPKTLTEMFIHFLLIQTVTRDEKYQTEEKSQQDDLLESQKELIVKLAELAFKNLESGNLMFYDKDLRECNIDVNDASVYSGLCTEIFKQESVFQQKVYCFVHLSIQEFLAAFYAFHSFVTGDFTALKSILRDKHVSKPPSCVSCLSSAPGYPLQELLKSAVDESLKSQNGHLDLFLRFLCGISLERNQGLLKGFLTQTQSSSKSIKETCQYIKKMNTDNLSPERCINLFHCMFEMDDQSMHNQIQKYMSSQKRSTHKLSPAHCSALAHMLMMSEEVLDEFVLMSYNTSDEGRRRLLPAFKCFRKARLAGCNFTDNLCEIVHPVLQSPNSLTELDLSDNNLGDSGVQLLAKGLSSPHCRLQSLRLSLCLISEKGCTFLAAALTSNPSHLKELDLSYNHPGESGLKLLTAKVKDPQYNLQILNTHHCAGIRLKADARKYACDVTLDPNTAHSWLSLSEGNRKVTSEGKQQPYPDHPDRFDCWEQVLCREGLSGHCYWEVEWSNGADIAVAYKSTKRKGEGRDVIMGQNAKSWKLSCSNDGSYSVWCNNKQTTIPAHSGKVPVPFITSGRVGVYLDWPAGTLSFYSVSSDTLTHLHTFHSTFTEPLYPGFGVYLGSSVSLCQIT